LKKGTKALNNFTHVECGQVFQALHMHRATLRFMDKLLFDITNVEVYGQATI